ncbi:RHS repeat-associated core domain-containing protein [Dyella marensis]|uniref:RHS repeat-associated core domain-containing protein n=2 Tax=Rhodanobacteraceae TaxID=1775411 RepID=A0A1I2JEA7_9GAMM|nr:RHS repeat-associated core domain-containing protein [Dyella marensis]
MDLVRRIALVFVCLALGFSSVGAKAQTYYGAPYYPAFSQYKGPFNTVAEAAQAWFAYYNVHYGLHPPDCNMFWTPYSEPGSATAGLVWLTSPNHSCGGGANGINATAYLYNPGKSIGHPGCLCAGDPIQLASGNEFHQDVDFKQGWLTFERYYNSDASTASTAMGSKWRHSFDRSLWLQNSNTTPTSGPLPPTRAVLYRPDGAQLVFTKANGQWSTDTDVADQLSEVLDGQGAVTGYTVFIASSRQFENYDASGQLQSITDQAGVGVTLTYSTSLTDPTIAPTSGLLLTVTDANGRQLQLAYDSAGKLRQVTQPDSGVLTYAHEASTGNLLSVTYPDASLLQYAYTVVQLNTGNTNPSALSGIIDETGTTYASILYNNYGAAIQSSLAGGVELTQISFDTTGSTTVTYALGLTSQVNFSSLQGLMKVTSVNQACAPACLQPFKARTYDTNGYPASTTDFNGNVTATTYDATGLVNQQVEASGTASQRTTTTSWNTTLRLPLLRTVSDANANVVARSGWVYNSAGQVLARCEIDVSVAGSYICTATGTVPAGVRRWTYTYCTAVDSIQCPIKGLLLSATGPRTDLSQTTTYSYYLTSSAVGCGTPGAACYQAGDLHTVTDALGRSTTIVSYDGAGRVTRSTDANGVTTDLTYTPRGWLASRTVGGATTSFTYTPYGAIASVTDPDQVTTSYTYDGAHRLTRITDALGNYVQYTLDAANNKTAEQVYDSSGTVRKSLSHTFNALSQLTATVDGLNKTVFSAAFSDGYDANGHLVHSADALGVQRKQGYDALNRLVSTIENYNGTDTATQNTQSVFAYGPRDELQGVSDPDGLNTTYDYDGLRNATAVHSPDTGTSSYVYDAAGNRIQATDARNIVSHSTYDALDRLTATTYPTSTENISYRYDEADSVTGCVGSAPIGHLTRVLETAVTTVYCYDMRGNVAQKRQTQGTNVDTVGYTYTAADRLASTLTPDGTAIQYGRDGAGRINAITVLPPGTSGAGAGNVVTNVTYLPFGPILSYTLGNGQTITRTYDANYAVMDVVSPALNLHFARDAMGNITALGNASGANPAIETYSYDPLYRLTGLKDAQGQAIEAYAYNKTGDRLSKVSNGLATGTYGYQAGTHWLTSIGSSARTYDANGNTTGSSTGGDTFGYGYNDRNRMAVVQRNGQIVANYTYNAMGQRVTKAAAANQRFAYDEGSQLIGEYGATSRSYVWLDNLPVAVVDTTDTASIVSYVHSDGLNTPRVVTDGTGATIWQWGYQANPFGEKTPSTAGMALNLRHPGQYYDAESGGYHNQQRDYDPATGRYRQSDPIGQQGGRNTYAYVAGNPLRYTDPTGTQATMPWVEPWIGGRIGAPIDVTPWMESRARGQTDPIQDVLPTDPGRDCNGNCKPCPPGWSWAAPGDEHGSTSDWHWHWIEYNQNPKTCVCYPFRRSSPSQPPNVPVHPLSPLQTFPMT